MKIIPAKIFSTKQVAGFLTDGIEAWADWRRFNIPEFPIYQGQRDAGHTTYPNRLMFGSSDYSANYVHRLSGKTSKIYRNLAFIL